MGNKFELLPQLIQIFPNDVDTFYDMFGGSGVVSLNVKAKDIIYNELNINTVNILKVFKKYTSNEIDQHIKKRIEEFDLPKSGNDVRQPTVTEKKIEYYKNNYIKFRKFYNDGQKLDLDLFTLTFFSFCNLFRFNNKNEFNMPFGNRSYTKDNFHEIQQTTYKMKRQAFKIKNCDVFDLLETVVFGENDFVYLDPPYLNTEAIYNEKRAFGGWNINHDYKLFEALDKLNEKGIKWCLSNVKENKGNMNTHLIKWAEKNNYRIIGMEKNYSALGKGSANTHEVCIINYEYDGDGFKKTQLKLF